MKDKTVHVDLFRGETFLRIEDPVEDTRIVILLNDRQKLALAKKLLRAIKLPTKGPVRMKGNKG